MGDNWVIDELERRGEEKGRTAEARRGVLRVIERRFGEVPPDLRTRMEGLSALDRLEQLLDEAVTCASMAEFREFLDKP